MATGRGRRGSDFDLAVAGRPTGEFLSTDPSTIRSGSRSVGLDST